jgi:hypothetical protein
MEGWEGCRSVERRVMSVRRLEWLELTVGWVIEGESGVKRWKGRGVRLSDGETRMLPLACPAGATRVEMDATRWLKPQPNVDGERVEADGGGEWSREDGVECKRQRRQQHMQQDGQRESNPGRPPGGVWPGVGGWVGDWVTSMTQGCAGARPAASLTASLSPLLCSCSC